MRTTLKRKLFAGAMLSLLLACTVQAAHLRVTNVAWENGPDNTQSYVTFDLAWNHSWRSEWVVPAAENITGADLTNQNWDAAWVFVKFRHDNMDAWKHATLSTNAADHAKPAGAALDVGRTDDGQKGIGAFIYRDVQGQGSVNFPTVKLRWLHGADMADTNTLDLAVHAIEMVYVPQGEFMAGNTNGVIPATAIGSIRDTANANSPFLVNTDAQFDISFGTTPTTVTVSNAFPSGYSAFYCMKYEITQGQYAAFLNAQPTGQADLRYPASYSGLNRYTITNAVAGVYTTIRPDRACNYLSWEDGCAYAAWAGLRPMTELEFEKACRGPRYPVASEFAWGGTTIMVTTKALSGAEDGTETVTTTAALGGAHYGGVSITGNGDGGTGPLRVGIFATNGATRVTAGASFWGIMELSGNQREQPVTIGHANGLAFLGTHGTGSLTVPAGWPAAGSSGHAWRGGGNTSLSTALRVGDRAEAVRTADSRDRGTGWRGVRTAR